MNEQINDHNSGSVNFVDEKKNGVGKLLYIAVITLVIIGISFLLFKRLTAKKDVEFNALPSVNVTHIRKGSIEKDISLMGNILPTDTYYVVAKVSGDIEKVYVKNGNYVKKGDPICDIDASKEIEAAYIQYDTAKKSYERMQKLYKAGDISLQSFETVKAQYEGLKLSYDTKVEYSKPVAVADGVIENTNMTENTSINQGTVLCYITSEDAKEINFGVTERVLAGIKLNDEVTIEKSGTKYSGYISNISNLIDPQTGLFKVKAVITSENSFASGIMAKVTFSYDKKNNINILPNELIYYETSMPYIFIVNDDNTLSKMYIEVGLENENYSEVLTNIDKSVKIVSTWNKDLAAGATVNVVKDEVVEDEIYINENFENDAKNIDINDFVIEDNTTIATESNIEMIPEKASISDVPKKNVNKTNFSDKNEIKDNFSFNNREINPNTVKITEVK